MDKNALHKITYGLYVVGSGKGDRINGQIVNTVMQITSDPPAFTVCINKENHTHGLIMDSGVLTVSVMDQETPMELIGTFGFKSGRDLEKFKGLSYRSGLTGAPLLLEHSVAFLEGEVTGQLDVGTHTLFCVRVVDCGILSGNEPLTYAYYHSVKKGKAPKSAPTYIGEQEKEQGDSSPAAAESTYTCNICGYVYDPSKGDPDSGIIAGTSFDDLPDSWACPICGAGKEEFTKES